jgi:hypothetical protein
MKRNVGNVDIVFRVLIAIIISILYINETITGTIALILGVVALYALVAGLIGCCCIYKIFKINTFERDTRHKEKGFSV